MKKVKGVFCALLLAASGSVFAGMVTYNLHTILENKTGNTADDFHLTLDFQARSALGFTSITFQRFVMDGVEGTFNNNFAQFNSLPANGVSLSIDLNTPDKPIQPGQLAEILIPFTALDTAVFSVTSAYWTLGGTRITSGTQPDLTAIRNSVRVVPAPGTLALLAAGSLGAMLVTASRNRAMTGQTLSLPRGFA